MGSHKGKKWKDRPVVIRYFAERRLQENKRRRIRRCNGEAFLRQWEKTSGAR